MVTPNAGCAARFEEPSEALVLAASAIACPLAWFAVQGWLDGYAYRVEVGLAPFLIAAGLICGTAAVAVGSQTLRAALANPVDALRSE